MKRFCIISNDLHTVYNFRGELLLDIAHQGYEVHILAPNIAMCPKDTLFFEDHGFKLHHFSMQKMGTNPFVDLKTLWTIYKTLKKIKPQKILSYTIKPVIYGTLAGATAKVPERYVLLSGLGFAFQNEQAQGKFKYIKKLFDQLFHTAIKKSHKVIFQNADDLKLIQQLGHLETIPTAVVNGSGVDIQKFQKKPLVLDATQQPQPIFIMVARLLKDKGIHEYIEAAKEVKQQYPQAKFHLVGWIDENPAAIKKEDLNQWIDERLIDFWGKLEDVRPILEQANIFVLPSYREGIPRSVLEAMAMGRAVITTDAPGCKETVHEGENGFKVPIQNSQKLAEAMVKLIEEPTLIQTMGEKSHHIILEKYDVKKVNQTMLRELNY